jgi:hypothetical protein
MTLMERIFNLFHLWTDRLIAYEHTWRVILSCTDITQNHSNFNLDNSIVSTLYRS